MLFTDPFAVVNDWLNDKLYESSGVPGKGLPLTFCAMPLCPSGQLTFVKGLNKILPCASARTKQLKPACLKTWTCSPEAVTPTAV